MSERPWRLLYEDMMEAAIKALSYCKDFNAQTFPENNLVIDATVRNLTIIGEAASRLKDEDRKRAPNVPWHRIAGLRNRIVHAYFDVDTREIWRIVQEELTEFRDAIQQTLDSSGKNGS